MSLSRRLFVVGAPLVVGGCVADDYGLSAAVKTSAIAAVAPDPRHVAMYGAVDTEPFPVPAADITGIDPRFLRQEVAYSTTEQPGTIVVDPNQRFLYLVRENGRALRFGVGVGKVEAFNFQGEATIMRKAEWPRWTPTPDMIAREPDRYGPVKAGLPGGAGNPLGPRAMYLYKDGKDTLYRLHGTVEPWTIGTKVSSGCIRLINQDVMDLYGRVPVGTKAVVLPAIATPSS